MNLVRWCILIYAFPIAPATLTAMLRLLRCEFCWGFYAISVDHLTIPLAIVSLVVAHKLLTGAVIPSDEDKEQRDVHAIVFFLFALLAVVLFCASVLLETKCPGTTEPESPVHTVLSISSIVLTAVTVAHSGHVRKAFKLLGSL